MGIATLTATNSAALVVESGEDKGKVYSLGDQELVMIGRDSSCDILFHDTGASRRHFSIERSGDLYFLVDQGSRNGVLLNGSPVKLARLSFGDLIVAGSTTFLFLSSEDIEEWGCIFRKTIGGYRVDKRVGQGGMGTVFRAWQESIRRFVALKILSRENASQQKHVDSFLREARSAGSINHPSIVQVYDVGTDKGYYFYSMEYMPGGSLADLFISTGRISSSEALRLMKPIAEGLEAAERMGIVHRDIKPANIMLDGRATPKIGDLGIATPSVDAPHQKGVIGTPAYMSPEQAKGIPVDHRSDLYSLGCTFYHLISGDYPFKGTEREMITKHVIEAPVPLAENCSDAGQDLSDIIHRLMCKSPDDRYQTARSLVDDLERCRNSTRKSLAADQNVIGVVEEHSRRSVKQNQVAALAPTKPAVEGMRVLLADDDEVSLEMLEYLCESINCRTETAMNGDEALSKFGIEEFDAVITDRVMPFVNGDELAMAIKRRSPQTPVIMLSSLGMEMRATGEIPGGVDLVISKPITQRRLERALALSGLPCPV